MVTSYNAIHGAPGMRLLPLQQYPTARAGGLMLHPFDAVISGLNLSMTALTAGAPTTSPSALNFSVTPGQAYLDGEISLVYKDTDFDADPITFSATPAANKLVYGYNNIVPYLAPTRLVVPWTAATLPTQTGSSAGQVRRLNGKVLEVGDMIAHCVDHDEFLMAKAFYQVVGKSGANITLAKYDPSFAPPTEEGRLRIWGNQMEKLCTTSNFSIEQEKRIFLSTMYPPYTNSNSHALFREPASLGVGTLRLFVHKFPLDVTLDLTTGSAAVPLDSSSANLLADALTSAGAGELLVRGKTPAATAALGAASRTFTVSGNTLTLAANASASITDGRFEITATDNPNVETFLYSIGFSSLIPTLNHV